MRSLVFVLLIGAACALNSNKIIGGIECAPQSQPHQVSLYFNFEYYCGGSLLNRMWVVSVAHCYKSHVVVRLGAHNIGFIADNEQFIWSSRLIPHPRYEGRRTKNNDIMLIKLSRPATLDEFVKPVALPTSCAPAGTMCKVSGWGIALNSSLTAHYNPLRCLDIPIVSDRDCDNSYPGRITDAMFCAGYLEGGKDTCSGDSGSAIVCNGELQGVVSWGLGCGVRGYPGVNVKVCIFNDWLNKTMTLN